MSKTPLMLSLRSLFVLLVILCQRLQSTQPMLFQQSHKTRPVHRTRAQSIRPRSSELQLIIFPINTTCMWFSSDFSGIRLSILPTSVVSNWLFRMREDKHSGKYISQYRIQLQHDPIQLYSCVHCDCDCKSVH